MPDPTRVPSPTPAPTREAPQRQAETRSPAETRARLAGHYSTGARLAGAARPPDDALRALMRGAGNRAVSGLLSAPRPSFSAATAHPALAALPARPAPVQRDARPDGAGATPDAIHHAASAGLATPARALPYLGELRRAFGPHRVDTLRAHISPDACDAMGAHAYATGDHLVFGGAPSLREVAHEAAHAIQQRGGLRLDGGVGRTGDRHEQHADAIAHGVTRGHKVDRLLDHYADPKLSSGMPSPMPSGMPSVQRLTMRQERLSARARSIYDQKAMAFEVALGNKLAEAPETHGVAELMLARVQKIVDAWAAKTGQALDDVYAEEFGWRGGDQYYGAFLMTAANIKEVFKNARNKPLRTKLKVVYNAVRNNNLAKWLKVAGEELTKKTSKSIEVLHEQRPVTDTRLVKVKPGFAKQSGLDQLLRRRELTLLGDLAQREKQARIDPEVKPGTHVHVHSHQIYSDALKWKDQTSKSNQHRIAQVMGPTPVMLQRTLHYKELPDLQPEEADQILTDELQPPLLRQPNTLQQFKMSRKDTKLPWSQGSMFYRVDPNSDTATEARKIQAHLEAGISGSTDLMLHAAQYLGIYDDQLYNLRLAMLAWMLPNRDHSYYEIMKAAEYYGLAFWQNPSQPGMEYQHPLNLKPMRVHQFKDLLPEKQFPAYFLTNTFKRTIEGDLHDPGFNVNHMQNWFGTRGVPAHVASNLTQSQLAWLDALETDVDHAIARLGGRHDNRNSMLEELRRAPGYTELARDLPNTEALLATLVETQARAALTGLGVPLMMFTRPGAPVEYYRDLLWLCSAVRTGTFDLQPDADRQANAREVARLRTDGTTQGLQAFIGTPFQLLFAALLREQGAGVESAGYDLIGMGDPRGALVLRGVPEVFASRVRSLASSAELDAVLTALDVHIANATVTTPNLDALGVLAPTTIGDLGDNGFKTAIAGYTVKKGGVIPPDSIYRRFAEIARIRTRGAITETGDDLDVELRASLRKFARDTDDTLDFRFAAKRNIARPTLDNNMNRMDQLWNDTHAATYRGLSDAELIAINEYSRLGGMGSWQSTLEGMDARKGVDRMGTMAPMLKAAISGLQRLPVHTGTVYNGQRFDASAPNAVLIAFNMYPMGTVIRQDNFLSAAKTFGSSFGSKPDYDLVWVISHIKTGRDIQPISTNFGEEEVLFAPGARFMVQSVQRIADPLDAMNGKILVHMREI